MFKEHIEAHDANYARDSQLVEKMALAQLGLTDKVNTDQDPGYFETHEDDELAFYDLRAKLMMRLSIEREAGSNMNESYSAKIEQILMLIDSL